MPEPRIAVVGAGVGGLAAALALANAGCDVTVYEKEQTPGGKMRVIPASGYPIDGGPTVFTMRWVFEEFFDSLRLSFADHVMQHDHAEYPILERQVAGVAHDALPGVCPPRLGQADRYAKGLGRRVQ